MNGENRLNKKIWKAIGIIFVIGFVFKAISGLFGGEFQEIESDAKKQAKQSLEQEIKKEAIVSYKIEGVQVVSDSKQDLPDSDVRTVELRVLTNSKTSDGNEVPYPFNFTYYQKKGSDDWKPVNRYKE